MELFIPEFIKEGLDVANWISESFIGNTVPPSAARRAELGVFKKVYVPSFCCAKTLVSSINRKNSIYIFLFTINIYLVTMYIFVYY